jgi:hypothetical protein
MSKRLLWALLLIAVSVIILILNSRGSVDITILPKVDITMVKSIAFLIFVSIGVTIGILLK